MKIYISKEKFEIPGFDEVIQYAVFLICWTLKKCSKYYLQINGTQQMCESINTYESIMLQQFVN